MGGGVKTLRRSNSYPVVFFVWWDPLGTRGNVNKGKPGNFREYHPPNIERKKRRVRISRELRGWQKGAVETGVKSSLKKANRELEAKKAHKP